MTVFLSVDQVIWFHDSEVNAPIIDRGKLEGAVMRPQSGFGDYLTFASLWEQAAALLHGLIQAHAFLDGNKRAAWISTVSFLGLNGFEVVNLKQRAMADYVEAIAEGKYELKATALWLYQHSQAF